MKKTIKGILIGIGALAVLGFGGCVATVLTVGTAVDSAVEEVDTAMKEVDTAIKEIEVTSSKEKEALDKIFANAPEPIVEKGAFNYDVTYTFTNDSELDFDYIQMDADVLDKDGIKLGTALANITDVKAGQTFKMKLHLYQDGAESYEILKFTSNIFE